MLGNAYGAYELKDGRSSYLDAVSVGSARKIQCFTRFKHTY